jgi:hypothetical protein
MGQNQPPSAISVPVIPASASHPLSIKAPAKIRTNATDIAKGQIDARGKWAIARGFASRIVTQTDPRQPVGAASTLRMSVANGARPAR